MSELAVELIVENKAKHERGENASYLDLGRCGLTTLPDLSDMDWLETLILSNRWWDWKQYKWVESRNNGPENYFKNITSGYLPTSLFVVYAGGEVAKRVQINNADFLRRLTKLKSLDLSFTLIKNTDFLKDLTNLQTLYLSSNQIKNVDPLKDLINLQYLYLSSNQIENVDSLENLTNLQYLDLRYNQINSLEPFLQLIKKGIQITLESYSLKKGIYLYENPVNIPPLEIVKQGNTTILNYFDERSKRQFKNTQIKLILIGNSTVGKTTLSRYLREQAYSPIQSTTHGVQNHRWKVPKLNGLEALRWKPNQKDMEVIVWDFGGQEYYHATHRLFLSRNAVYTIVWDAKTDRGGIEPTKIYYENDPQTYIVPLEHFSKAWWLKNLHFNLNKYPRHEQEGGTPIPILLVQNKCAAGEEYAETSVPIEFEQKPYSLKPTWTKHHIDLAATAIEQSREEQGEWTMRLKLFENELLKMLESQLATYEFAVYHRDIRDRILALASGENPVDEISWMDFENLCRDIEPDAKMDLVQIYLRDITGDILYFDQNKRLKQRVFLRPDLVCNRIYAILSRKVLEREGLFDLTWVREALHCDEQEALNFVELMREFQLVFEENDENGKTTGNFVAPQYLPDVCANPGQLDGAKKYANLAHAFTLWFPEFLPKSHIARFVAHWGHQAKQRLFWKNGLLFQTDGSTVLVELYEEFKIRVDVQMSLVANREKAIRQVFQSFLDLEDGQAGFAVSLDGKFFAAWQSIQKAIHMQDKKVEVYASNDPNQWIKLEPFYIFHQPVTIAKKVFISYSHKDKSFKDDLDTHFSALKLSGLVDVWSDRRIDAGAEWDDAIKSELKSADIILLLISASFLASEYIWKVEITQAIARHQNNEGIVVPIFIRPCDVKGMPFEGIQGLPHDAKPVATFIDKDEAYVQITKGIRAILEN